MSKRKTTIYIRGVDDDYMQIVKEFAVHRRMSLKALVLAALDQYITKSKPKDRKQGKEV